MLDLIASVPDLCMLFPYMYNYKGLCSVLQVYQYFCVVVLGFGTIT